MSILRWILGEKGEFRRLLKKRTLKLRESAVNSSSIHLPVIPILESTLKDPFRIDRLGLERLVRWKKNETKMKAKFAPNDPRLFQPFLKVLLEYISRK